MTTCDNRWLSESANVAPHERQALRDYLVALEPTFDDVTDSLAQVINRHQTAGLARDLHEFSGHQRAVVRNCLQNQITEDLVRGGNGSGFGSELSLREMVVGVPALELRPRPEGVDKLCTV